MSLFGSFVEKNGLLQNRSPRSRRPSGGIGGSREATSATLKSFSIGGFELHDVPAEFHDAEEGAFSARHIAGNLGAQVLKRFRVVLDRTNAVMYLSPGAGWDKPFSKDRSGLQVRSRGAYLEVTFVAPGSPAAAAHLKVGERIEAAIEVDLVGPSDPSEDWRTFPAGTKVILKDRSGAERTLVLADYY